MTPILSTTDRIQQVSLVFFLLFFMVTPTIWGQNIQKGGDKSKKDSTQLEVIGFPDVTPPPKDSALDAHFEYFWILGNGNFIPNTRSNAVYERYQQSPSTNSTPYEVKVYSTSIYVGEDDEPPRIILTDTITLDTATTGAIARTNAVKADYLNLQFNHNEIVPGDTTLWVLSLKNPLFSPSTQNVNNFSGEVYLFFNSPVKFYEQPVKQVRSKGEAIVKSVAQKELVLDKDAAGHTRFPNFKYNTSFIYNNSFLPTAFDISGSFSNNSEINNAYRNGLLWHFDFSNNMPEQHLFLEFEDADNIFTPGDTSTRFVDFLAVLVVNDTTFAVADSLTTEEIALISALKLNNFTNYIAGSISNNEPGDNIIPNPLSTGLDFLNSRIIDVYNLETKVKRAHDPNMLTIQTCNCPAGSDGAQKLILTAEFENDGEAPTTEVKVSIPIPAQIDIASISGDILAFHAPGLERSDIVFTIADDNKTATWTFTNLVLHGTKYLGTGNPLTFGQFTFTALTTPGTDIADVPEMHACIYFSDAHGALDPICTQAVKPKLLTVDESASKDVQNVLSCQECTIIACYFPIWLICLIIAVIIFAIWIVVYKKGE